MTQAAKKKTSMTKRIVSIVLFALSAVLIITSIAGFVIRGMDSTAAHLNEMRTSAVVHVASGGLVDGNQVEMIVKAGQSVLVGKYSGSKVKLEDVEYTIVRQSDILAVIE